MSNDDLLKRIEELETRLSSIEYRFNNMQYNNSFQWNPVVGPAPTWPQSPPEPPKCLKCGISLTPVMGYVCPNFPCPSGLGSNATL